MITINLNPLRIIQDVLKSDKLSLQTEAEITGLITPRSSFEKPDLENINTAYEIVKEIPSVTFMLTDICRAYLKLRTEDGCDRAYEVALYKEKRVANIYKLLNEIVDVCVNLVTYRTICLGKKILNSHPYLDKGTIHNLKVATSRLGGPKDLVMRGQFTEAIEWANNESKDSSDSAMREVFSQCCSRGDEEALRVAYKIAVSKEKSEKDTYISEIISVCLREGNKGLALYYADKIRDDITKNEKIRKINKVIPG